MGFGIRKGISLIVPLLPLLSVYKSPISLFDLGTFSLIILFLASVTLDIRVHLRSNTLLWIMYTLYIFIISVFAYLNCGFFSIRVLKQILFVIFILCFLDDEKFDYDFAERHYKLSVIVCTTFLFIQILGYYFLGVGIPGYIPGLLYTENYADRLQYVIASGFFRPTSFFYEPTHYAAFSIAAIVIYLFKGKKRDDIKWALFITAGVIASTSSMGIGFALLIWAYWMYKNFLSGNQNRILFSGIILLFSTIPIMKFFKTTTGTLILNRTIGSGVGVGGNAIVGRLLAYNLLLNGSISQMIFGRGYGNVDEAVSYYSSWAFNLMCLGMIGSVIVLVIFLKYFNNSQNDIGRLMVIIFALRCIVEFTFSTTIMLFNLMFVIPFQKDYKIEN